MIETIDQMIEVDHETTIDMMIGEIAADKMIDMTIIGKNIEEINTETTIGQITEETIIGNRDIELQVKVGKILEIITGIIQGKDLGEVETEVEIEVEKGNDDQDLGLHQKIEVIGQDQNLGLDQI